MRKYVDRLNKAIILGCFLVGVVTLDPTAMIASAVLYIATLNPRCSSLYYLMLIYNLHFSIRYIEQRLFGFEDVFTQPKVELLGGYFLLSAFMYLGIALAINASARTDRDRSLAFSTSLGKVGAVSILIFSALSFAGQYSIGREIGNPLSRLLIRLSLFLQYWVPALFFLKNWLLYAPIYIAGMLIFGSKAFIYNLVLLSIIYGIIANTRIKMRYVLIVLACGVLSILMFDVILQYRLTKEFKWESLAKLGTSVVGDSNLVYSTLSHVSTRWGGLDTLVAYGQVDFRYSLSDIGHEVVVGINNLLPVFKIPLPENYISSELYTAYLFRGYNYFDVAAGGLRHTDSMFGLSRFVAADYGIGIVLYALCLLFAFLFRSRDYFADTLLKILFYTSVLVGGSYAETVRIFLEFTIITVLLRLRSVRSMLCYYGGRLGTRTEHV